MHETHSIRRSARALLLVTAIGIASTRAARAQSGTTAIVGRASQAIALLSDSLALHKAGYFAIGFGGGVKDLTPFQGQHWVQVGRFLANGAVDLSVPNFMMYLPLGDSLVPIGVAYSRRVPADAALPTDLDGTTAEWHAHIFCRNIPGEGNVLADGPEDCKARSGTAAPNQIAMVHTWTIANPDGPFAHDNPALPYVATGLTPPAHATADDRLLGVALGESYGARIVAAHLIDRTLRNAERAGDAAKVAAARKKLIDAWSALATEYRAAAPTSEMRARFDLELGQAIGAITHHHM